MSDPTFTDYLAGLAKDTRAVIEDQRKRIEELEQALHMIYFIPDRYVFEEDQWKIIRGIIHDVMPEYDEKGMS